MNVSPDEQGHLYLQPSSGEEHCFHREQNVASQLEQAAVAWIETDPTNSCYNANSTYPLPSNTESSLFVGGLH